MNSGLCMTGRQTVVVMSKPVKLGILLMTLCLVIAGNLSGGRTNEENMEITRYSISVMNHELISFSIENSGNRETNE